MLRPLTSPRVGTLREVLKSRVTWRAAAAALLLLTVVAGSAVRLTGSTWDDGAHLHPDERYLSTVADSVDWPGSVAEYFDVEQSPLSPYNTQPGRDYLYGLLPLYATKLVGTTLGEETYDELYLVGRRLGAVLDALLIPVVFAIALFTFGEPGGRRAVEGGLVGAALYGFTVTAIQHAHFFTTDVWLLFFATLTFLLASLSVRRAVDADAWSPAPILLLLGGAFGLTVACKVSGALVALPVALALLGRAWLFTLTLGGRRALVHLVVDSTTVLVTAYVTFRAVSPYVFARSSWLDLSVEPLFRQSLERQADAVAGPSSFPPSYQWLLSTPIWSPLENLALWQLGIPLAVSALIGLVVLVLRIVRAARELTRATELEASRVIPALVSRLMLVTYVLAVFIYFASRFVHSGRYLLPLVPLLAVAAAFGLAVAAGHRQRLWRAAAGLVVAATALWALGFVRIYTEPSTRIAASNWIRANVPVGATIANEHWDDPLPVRAVWSDTRAGARALNGYHGILVPVFDPDGPEKLRRLYADLARADYYVVSSPRASNTIARMPDRFPLMARFYDELFEGGLGFVEARRFESYPGLLGARIRDGRAEEAFWVYDHPPVVVLRRNRELEWPAFRAALCREPAPTYCA